MPKICHLTSAHIYTDTRILYKECFSLQQQFGAVTLIAPGKKDQTFHGVKIIAVKKLNRLKRMWHTVNEVYQKAIEVDADIYHFHDPELIRVGLKLKNKGKKVIFDIHENIALQILDKEYIPKYLRILVSKTYRAYEKYAIKKLDGVILAESSYANYYTHLNKNHAIVLNMPQIDKIKGKAIAENKRNELFYIGGITKNRGILIILESIKILKSRNIDIFFNCVGPVPEWLLENELYQEVKDNVSLKGTRPLLDSLDLVKSAKIGISVLKPIENYKRSFSTKIFEYMAMGLPVITSNFKLYRDVVEEYQTGFCINPLDCNELADKIEILFSEDILAKEMGQNGMILTEKKFNWAIEEKKLFDFYENLI